MPRTPHEEEPEFDYATFYEPGHLDIEVPPEPPPVVIDDVGFGAAHAALRALAERPPAARKAPAKGKAPATGKAPTKGS